ncbi:SUN domain-containing protein 3-like isoform X1 [Entelurus aequoreus]|uniref:SUN domain-containing protein 3-like isoform X1 n=1 Tax=Entelurus aequoreus TaxID=161455 RepID=UPI002B1DC89C|nr:SUN domain-containing protein 3-like isoform X1 [Entelurus aequoreus]
MTRHTCGKFGGHVEKKFPPGVVGLLQQRRAARHLLQRDAVQVSRRLWTRYRTIRPRRAVSDDDEAKDDLPLSDSPARTGRVLPRIDGVLRFARKYIITILMGVLWFLCEPSIRQMTGFPAPSYLFSEGGAELPEEFSKMYNDVLERLKAFEQKVLEIDDKPPPWASIPNFALKSAGASVLCAATSKAYKAKIKTVSVLGFQIRYPEALSASVVIEGKSELIPGNCWAFSGDQGNLTMVLSHPALVQHVTLGHISKRISPTGSIPHAPNLFSVYGTETLDSAGIKLGTFYYNQEGEMFQNFIIPEELHALSKYVTLSIHSNWGDPTFTCVYSFWVHGALAS